MQIAGAYHVGLGDRLIFIPLGGQTVWLLATQSLSLHLSV